MNELKITTLEKQILHCWVDNPNTVFTEPIFVSEQAQKFSQILMSLKNKGMSFIAEHIYVEGGDEANSLYIAVLDTDYERIHLDTYKHDLMMFYIKRNFRDKAIQINDGDFSSLSDIDELLGFYSQLKSSVSTNNGKTFSEIISEHKSVIRQRAKGISVTNGCYNIDKIIPNPTAGIITVVGYSGSCKSTFVQYWVKQRIAKRLPTILFNTELSVENLVDSLTASMVKVKYEDIQGLHNEDEHIDYDYIEERYEELERQYSSNRRFRMCDKSKVSIDDIISFVTSCKNDFDIMNDELPTFVFIDLLSMVSDFNTGYNRADAITQGLNRLNALALENNLIIIGTVQLRRITEKVTIDTEEDVDKLIPTLGQIKDSGTWEERSRAVLAIHNPYHLVRKNPCSEMIRELINEPIISIVTLKNSYNDRVGDRIKYLLSSEYKSFVVYNDEEDEEESEGSDSSEE